MQLFLVPFFYIIFSETFPFLQADFSCTDIVGGSLLNNCYIFSVPVVMLRWVQEYFQPVPQ